MSVVEFLLNTKAEKEIIFTFSSSKNKTKQFWMITFIFIASRIDINAFV